MNARQAKLLGTIIDEFIRTGIPVGSRHIIDQGFFPLSCATIRNEMRSLGEEGFLEQPHISAGRVPTAKGYRMYVQDLLQPTSYEADVRRRFLSLKEQYIRRKEQEMTEEVVALLSHMTPNVAFATVPHKERVYFLGLANTLRQPEFQENPQLATGVVEILESRLSDVLSQAQVDERIRYYIGDEHLLPQIQSCSMLVRRYQLRGDDGVIGILGPMRMDYGYNTVALDLAADLLMSGGVHHA